MNHLSFALRRAAIVSLLLAFTVALVACGGQTPGARDDTDDAAEDGGSTASVTNGTVAVTADDLAFDVETIEAPAGEPFTIELTNAENVPHNLSVYTEQDGEQIALGDIINEGETDQIEVEALEPGEYFFVCDLHPTEMTGTLLVEG